MKTLGAAAVTVSNNDPYRRMNIQMNGKKRFKIKEEGREELRNCRLCLIFIVTNDIS